MKKTRTPKIKDSIERYQLEEKLHHAYKLETLGTLTGSVAHDFNNVLTAIMGYGHLLQMRMKEDDPSMYEIEQILASAQRAANLTQSLLAFSRKKVSSPNPINLAKLIKEMGKFLLRFISENIELNTIVAEDDLTVMADSSQIEQVLINLCTNARDAMPAGGCLTIETACIKLDTDFLETYGYGKRGDYALISVTDTGMGMNEETKKKIFKPFFTTKEDGKGTGLGLSIVYRIVKQHNGYINVYSELDKGTTFKIYLPLITSKVEEEKPAELIAPIGGSEAILLAEDDVDVRELTKAVLEKFGYTVIAAENGEDAINKFMPNKDKIHILLLDMVMPKKSGKEVYKEIKKIRPAIKALFTSGYPSDFIDKEKICEQGLDFIPKPLAPQELLRKLREVLDNDMK
jgi:nitrogen-specific signal transduction histidine kinase/CheY-like chemotaxis protein